MTMFESNKRVWGEITDYQYSEYAYAKRICFAVSDPIGERNDSAPITDSETLTDAYIDALLELADDWEPLPVSRPTREHHEIVRYTPIEKPLDDDPISDSEINAALYDSDFTDNESIGDETEDCDGDWASEPTSETETVRANNYEFNEFLVPDDEEIGYDADSDEDEEEALESGSDSDESDSDHDGEYTVTRVYPRRIRRPVDRYTPDERPDDDTEITDDDEIFLALFDTDFSDIESADGEEEGVSDGEWTVLHGDEEEVSDGECTVLHDDEEEVSDGECTVLHDDEDGE